MEERPIERYERGHHEIEIYERKRRVLTIVCLLATSALPLAYTACSGFSAAQQSTSNGASSLDAYTDTPVAKACTPTLRGTSELGIRRLTKPELVASFGFLFGSKITSDARVIAALADIPEQTVVTNAAFDNTIVDVAGIEAVGDVLATVTFEDPSLINTVLGGCVTTDVGTCTNNLIANFGLKAFRRPMPADTAAAVRSLVTSVGGTDGLKSAITRILISPYFHQKIELGVDADNTAAATIDPNAPLKLSQYEVASRIAFEVSGGPPDMTLLNAAASGQLTTLDQVKAQCHGRSFVTSSPALF